MVNLPISDYVKNYYQGRNIVLDDFTQAAIIASQRPEWMGWSKRLSMLQDIADNTADECLKLQIEDHINYRLRQKSRFMDNQGGRYFYYCSGYWTTIDKAIECGKQSGDSKISIIKFDTSKYEVMPSEAAMAGEAIWDTDGNTVLQLFSYTAIEEYPKDTHGRKTRFDLETIIPCVFPFARGML